MARESRVIVGNKAGEEYSVTRSAFHSMYEPRGFTILRNEDGSPVESSGDDRPKRPALQARAKELGVSAGGTNEEIMARIADAESVPPTPAPVEGTSEETPQE